MAFARSLLAALGAAVLAYAPAVAQEAYPSRQITIVVPISSGTTIDILARLYADRLAKTFGQRLVVSNKPGAGGAIAAQAVAASPPDGYTLLFVNSGHAILGVIKKDLAYDPVKDFAGVALVGKAPAVVVVPPALGVDDLKAFVAMAKAKPGELHYGSAGVGTSTHVSGAYFEQVTGTQLVHVPYTVSATIIADLLGGRLQGAFVPLAFVLPMVQSNRLRVLAVGDKDPITEPLAVPTAQAQGVDYHYATWYGILTVAKTPKPILDSLHRAIAEAGRDPEMQRKIREQGIDPQDMGPEQLDGHVRAEMARLNPLLQSIAEK